MKVKGILFQHGLLKLQSLLNISALLLSLVFSASAVHAQSKELSDDNPSEALQVYIPNAFTPNADSTNDFWVPVISGPAIEFYDVVVLNRDGSEVFQSNDPKEVWGGGIDGGNYVPTASIYIYFLKLRVAGDLETKVYRGHITLVR